MSKLFLEMECLSESKTYNNKSIYEKLFDKHKRLDKRFLSSAIKKFEQINIEVLDFLDLDLHLTGSDNDLKLSFISSNYIGAIPLRMPYDGIARKDLVVKPRFFNNQDSSELIKLLRILEHSVEPDYIDIFLVNSFESRLPIYYEAVKYIDLFEQASKANWVRFEVVSKINNYPKSNTDWSNYAKESAYPEKSLEFKSNDSILSKNHKEWQELCYVFELSKKILLQSTAPLAIKYKYKNKIQIIEYRLGGITSTKSTECIIKASDPIIIKKTKKQANKILKKELNKSLAWRVDMAELFEKYVQHLFRLCINKMSGGIVANYKIRGEGYIPKWGLKYLEPDILINYKNHYIVVDAKYKSNFYSIRNDSDILKETHREDLHQILAYSSFLPNAKDNIAILVYPADRVIWRTIAYKNSLTSIKNRVLIAGVPLNPSNINKTISDIQEMLNENINK